MEGGIDTKIPGSGKARKLVSAGMDRLLQDESTDSYRTAFRILFFFVTVLSLVSLVLAGGLAYAVKKGRKGDRFFAMHFDGKTKRLRGLRQPSLNDESMLSWTAAAATDIMTFGFSDVDRRLKNAERYFTEIGYQSFLRAIKKSQVLKTLTKNQQIMTAIPMRQPRVAYKGFRKGQYVWDIQVPLLLTVRAGERQRTAQPTLFVTIVRVPTSQDPSGWGIGQWTMF